MATIRIAVLNDTPDDYNIHIYDQFAHGHRELAESPLALASGATSSWLTVNADAAGEAIVAYSCDGGPSLSDIHVQQDSVIDVR